MNLRATNKCSGFTLIEVLMAVLVVGTLVALFSVTIGVSRLTRDMKYEDIALRVASHELEAQRALGYATSSSRILTDTLLTELPSGAGSTTVAAYNDRTKQVTVSVSWDGGANDRSITLTSLITELGGL